MIRMKWNLRTLSQFIKVVDLGSISRAATELGTTQPGLSRVMRQFEEELGWPLFERGPRSLTITREGEIVSREGRAILKRAKQGWKRMRQEIEGGEIRVEKEIEGAAWYGSQSAIYGDADPIRVTLRKAWRITGRVTVDGNAAPNVQIMIARRLNNGGNASGLSMSKHEGVAKTDVQGKYEFTVPPDERYSVSVISSPIDGSRSSRGLIPTLVADGELRAPDFEYTSED
jgi:hypothetical protein